MRSLPLAAADKPPRKIKYIDIHTHLGAFYFGQELTAELLVRFMDQHDVEKACVLPLISPESAPITPKLPLIGHAAGFWASISGDATFEDFGRYPEVPKKIAPGGALDRLLK